MKINLGQLPALLNRGLAPFYWLSSDDAVLQEEALSLILDEAQKNGFHEKQHFALSSQFDDDALWQSLHNRCLWQQKKIISIHLSAGKLTQKGANHFLECLRLVNSDTMLIIQSLKLEAKLDQSAWYKSADAKGVFLPLWPLTEKEQQKWLNDKIKAFQLNLDDAARHALLINFDGNLLATKNALHTLKLAYKESSISEKEVLALITPQGDYNLNQLTDAILQAEGTKAERIVQHLRLQGVEIVLLLWAVLRELRLLTLLSSNPMPSDQDLLSYRLWPQRKALLLQAARRLPHSQWKALFKTAAACDKIIKGVELGNPWLLLSQLVCSMSTGATSFAFLGSTRESPFQNAPVKHTLSKGF
ncbi:MAG: polymerase subunit delta [Gammaproteobacteria bacterium]|jgi:DNA polymerase-3 subunit delta|nr:polymerase subunit delta [Gammaproteobacteria bacterium]